MTATATIEIPKTWNGGKPTREQFDEILRLHGKWLRGEADGAPADLSYANLRSADLSYANLRYANLSYANLRYANLSYANLSDETTLSGGFVWKAYLEELVPALLIAGGKKLEEVANAETWACHSWGDPEEQLACPIATAFSVHNIGDVPILYREQANFFIQLFDGGIVPLERVLAGKAAP